MVHHSAFNQLEVPIVCGCSILPLKATAKGPAALTDGPDIVDEAIDLFRANVLFRSFDVRGSADILLLYLIMYISACLKVLADKKPTREEGERLLYSLAHEPFKGPGDAGFALGSLMCAPTSREEDAFIRSYLRQCREEISRRLCPRVYTAQGPLNKFWLAFSCRKMLNKTLT